MDDIAIVLRLDVSDQAPEGPGWYLYATKQRVDSTATLKEALAFKPQRVSGRAALKLATDMQVMVTPTEGDLLPTQLVKAGNDKVIRHIQGQIDYAERQAQRIGQLRRILQTESEQGE